VQCSLQVKRCVDPCEPYRERTIKLRRDASERVDPRTLGHIHQVRSWCIGDLRFDLPPAQHRQPSQFRLRRCSAYRRVRFGGAVGLELLTDCCLESAPASDASGDCEEAVVDVGAAFPSLGETSELVEQGEGMFHDPAHWLVGAPGASPADQGADPALAQLGAVLDVGGIRARS
jgi:hypothetical protein